MNYLITNLIKKNIQHFSELDYWKKREVVYNQSASKIVCLFYHYQIRKMEAFSQASIGLHPNGGGAKFGSRPILPHGLNGIIINDKAVIGKNCTIFHQVTIGEGKNGGVPTIGDNCFIGAGAKIIGNVTVGNNVRIGANAVVVFDIPDNATVVMEKPRILMRNE
jgi:serine O-acetyltransferase